MAFIYQSTNNGNSGRKVNKDVKTHSYNVSPTTLVAIPAPGLLFPENELQNYEYFVVDQTSADTDEIMLPASLPVGTVIVLHSVDIVRISSEASSSVGINGGTDTQEVATLANSTMVLTKVSATNIIASLYSSAGAFTAPTAS